MVHPIVVCFSIYKSVYRIDKLLLFNVVFLVYVAKHPPTLSQPPPHPHCPCHLHDNGCNRGYSIHFIQFQTPLGLSVGLKSRLLSVARVHPSATQHSITNHQIPPQKRLATTTILQPNNTLLLLQLKLPRLAQKWIFQERVHTPVTLALSSQERVHKPEVIHDLVHCIGPFLVNDLGDYATHHQQFGQSWYQAVFLSDRLGPLTAPAI